MKRFAPLGVAVIAALIAQCALADKSGELIDATNPKKIASVIQDLGYRAKLEVDDDGDPVIRSGTGGSSFSIQFYGCKEVGNDECDLLLFSAGYDFDEETALETINSWNEQALVGRAYLDDDGDPRFDWAVNMRDGVSRENFEDSIRRWAESLGDFEDHIDY